jgi:hypothetical protein
MSVLRALVLVGVVGCSHAATPPASPVVPEPPAPAQQTTRPTRVDHARLNLNSAYASLVRANLGVRSSRPAYAVAFAPACRSSADCGGGELSCRAREDGVRVCMGLGSPGEACWFNTDCVWGACTLSGDRRTCK